MTSQQAIENPHGVTTYGSHLLRVNPDLAVISVAINRLAAKPAEAFHATRKSTAAVREFLRTQGLSDADVRSSHITLKSQFRHVSGASEFVGHQASVEVSVSLTALEELETVLVGMVEAGANQVKQVHFKTKRLRELRSRARAAAIAAARAKALLYCEAAEVTLGKVLHIEDVDPTRTRGREYGHMVDQDLAGENADNDPGAYHPGTISVNGAAVVSFAIL